MTLFLRALFFTVLMPGTAVVWIPRMLAARDAGSGDLGPWRWVGVPLMAAGAAVSARVHRGLRPQGARDARSDRSSRKLVAVGLYRSWNRCTCVVTTRSERRSSSIGVDRDLRARWLVFHLFVVLYEEPHLEGAFGAEYERYRATSA